MHRSVSHTLYRHPPSKDHHCHHDGGDSVQRTAVAISVHAHCGVPTSLDDDCWRMALEFGDATREELEAAAAFLGGRVAAAVGASYATASSPSALSDPLGTIFCPMCTSESSALGGPHLGAAGAAAAKHWLSSHFNTVGECAHPRKQHRTIDGAR